MKPAINQVDVAIIGGGITGTALFYELARRGDAGRVVLLEKYPTLASVNSDGHNNSQTLHCGDIETNYTLEKALQVRQAAQQVIDYAEALPANERERLILTYPKMVLGVGERECEQLVQRFDTFRYHFPEMELLDAEGIAALEPKVVAGRRERIVALATRDHYSAVDFQRLAHSFVAQARHLQPRFELRLASPVTAIREEERGFQLTTAAEQITARAVVVCAGGHSLLYAQQMGYGKEYACLPVAGSFYFTPPLLNGKVYTVQNDKLPFAAVHGDPDLLTPGVTRFGPTALVLPLLERRHWGTLLEFLQVTRPELAVLKVLGGLLKEPEVRAYMLRNLLYEVPGVGKRLFLQEARKIVPSLQLGQLQFARGIGGIRPVMIDKVEQRLRLGEAQIDPGNGILFNMTPSPGATSCLANARRDAERIVSYL
ncbi:MAG: FAD-dependent oxidoreductase [Gammaproteobacteria bacterium]|nr:FAD-dependent oxidoreductase [Gammaproteobacteria bacterium]